MASLRSLIPARGPYLLWPSLRAFANASIISCGGWMSGSPSPRFIEPGGAASNSFLIPDTLRDETRLGNMRPSDVQFRTLIVRGYTATVDNVLAGNSVLAPRGPAQTVNSSRRRQP